jgi:hypothetical protein
MCLDRHLLQNISLPPTIMPYEKGGMPLKTAGLVTRDLSAKQVNLELSIPANSFSVPQLGIAGRNLGPKLGSRSSQPCLFHHLALWRSPLLQNLVEEASNTIFALISPAATLSATSGFPFLFSHIILLGA